MTSQPSSFALPATGAAASPASREASGWGPRGTTGTTFASALAFEDIHHAYGAAETLHGVSLAVRPGEILCLLGHSGCGKTTLMRIAAGVEPQSRGRVLINGEEVAGPARFLPPEQRGVGLMFQDYALFPHLTNRENVMFGLTRLSRTAAAEVADQILARVGLGAYAADYPHSLSGGEQQRVALARAIAPRPGILLMDEPFSGLDSRLRDDVREETLAILRETRATCVMVTHDPEEAMRMGDRIALMRSGRLVQHGTAEDLYLRPVNAFAARFFSEVNEFDGIIRGGRVDCPLGVLPFAGSAPLADGTAVHVCLRPDGIRLLPAGEGLAARVISRRFIGTVDLVLLAYPGSDRPLQARLRPGDQVRVGADVGIAVEERDVLVFAKSSPSH
ncbi:ABC transporter ATP-binding protein [Pannonibacter tanglangensis]|uniref:ABC transporter ATP-binding protein n=1 Tax=Pannonibacter tanglangensis TaxID=2750084 RepID=UPI003741EB32